MRICVSLTGSMVLFILGARKSRCESGKLSKQGKHTCSCECLYMHLDAVFDILTARCYFKMYFIKKKTNLIEFAEEYLENNKSWNLGNRFIRQT